MNFKKIMSTALAGVMALSLSATALAGETDLEQSTEITGTTQTPTISISVPQTGAVILNPYKMSVDVSADQDGSDLVTSQIISAPTYIKNKTDVALSVSASVTGKVEGQAVFATASTQGGTRPVTTNSAFVYLEVIDAGAGDDDTATAPTTAPTDASWHAYDAKAANQILLAAKAVNKANMLTVPAVAADNSSFIAYRLAGDAASSPTNAWTPADKISATIVFTFTPTVAATPAP